MIVPSLTDEMGGQSVLLKGPANLKVDIDQTFVKVKIEEREVPGNHAFGKACLIYFGAI